MSKMFALVILSGSLIVHVSNNSASSCSINTDRNITRPVNINKLVDNLINVRQGVSTMVARFNDPGVSNMGKTVLAEWSKQGLAQMSEELATIARHKDQSPQGSKLYKDFSVRQLDSLAKNVQADYGELKKISDSCEKNDVKFSPDTKREDGGRVWSDRAREWK
jgi:hypothetical protein